MASSARQTREVGAAKAEIAKGRTDAEAAVDGAAERIVRHAPGMIVHAGWAGGDNAKMRLVERYEHPAGNGWRVNIYDHHRKRYSKVIQSVDDATLAKASPRSSTTGGAA